MKVIVSTVALFISAAVLLYGCECRDHGDCASDERCIDNSCRSEPSPCGDQPPHPECMEEPRPESEDECESRGGLWTCFLFCYCLCYSGDVDCPCWNSKHCEGDCLGDKDNCVETKIGRCSNFSPFTLGCNCYFWDGSFGYGCAD